MIDGLVSTPKLEPSGKQGTKRPRRWRRAKQSDNNQAFQFAVSLGQTALAHSLALPAAFSAGVSIGLANIARSPGDANKEMEGT